MFRWDDIRVLFAAALLIVLALLAGVLAGCELKPRTENSEDIRRLELILQEKTNQQNYEIQLKRLEHEHERFPTIAKLCEKAIEKGATTCNFAQQGK